MRVDSKLEIGLTSIGATVHVSLLYGGMLFLTKHEIFDVRALLHSKRKNYMLQLCNEEGLLPGTRSLRLIFRLVLTPPDE